MTTSAPRANALPENQLGPAERLLDVVLSSSAHLWHNRVGRNVEGAWQPLPGRAFEQRNWPSDVRFVAGDGQGAARILFDRVGTSPTPQAVVLSGGDAREIVRVSAAGDVSRGE